MRCGAPRGSVDRRAAHRNMGAPPPCSGRPSPGRMRQRPAYLRAVRRRRTLMTSRHRAATRWRWSRRVPLRHQLTGTECAPACLAMVASYHGRDTRVADFRQGMGAGRDGISVPRLVDAARGCGFLVEVDQEVDPVATPPDAPAIAYLSERPFVVLELVGRRGVRIADPALGRTWLSGADFRRRYGNALVRLRPGPYFARRRTPPRQALIVRYLREFVAAPGGRRLLA